MPEIKTKGTVDLLLIWPPISSVFWIPNTIPLLTAYAKSIGLKTTQIDGAIGYTRYLLSAEGLLEHKPKTSDPRKIYKHWRILYNYIKKHCDKAFKYGDIPNCVEMLDYVYDYYGYKYPCTTFHDESFRIKDYPLLSSLQLKPAVNRMMSQQKHPIIDYYRNFVLPAIQLREPKIIGLSIMDRNQIIPALLLATMIRRLNSKSHIVAGGAYLTYFCDTIQKHPERFYDPIDSIVIGEGEPALDGFLSFIRGACDLRDINNILLPGEGLRKEKRFVEIENLPPPEFNIKSLTQHIQPIRLPVELSRGCYWGRCAFCIDKFGVNSRHRTISPRRIVQNMIGLKRRYNCKHFTLSTLGASPAQLEAITNELRCVKHKFKWSVWIRLERGLTYNIMRAAKEVGCDHIYLAPESFCQKTLDRMKKGYNANELIRISEDLRSLGYAISLNIVAGFPGERVEQLEETFRICNQNKYSLGIFPFALERQSDMFKNAEQYGLIIDQNEMKAVDITLSLPYRVKKGVPHYSWKEVRGSFIRKYEKYYCPTAAHGVSMHDKFDFGGYYKR